MIFYRPSKQTEYVHIDALFGEPGKNTIDFDLIESQFRHLMRVAVSVHEGATTSTASASTARTNSASGPKRTTRNSTSTSPRCASRA
ncbi:Tn3 family transposase [Streptomyces decoyicus]